LVSERLVTLSDIEDLTSFFYRSIEVDAKALVAKSTAEEVKAQLTETISALKAMGEWTHEAIESQIRSLQEKHTWKKGQYFMMLRLAVTGRAATPPLFETMAVIGKDEILARLNQAQSVA
jgi:glutamyl-tRNA synthetase